MSKEPIHSGHFMTSNPHSEIQIEDEDEDVEVDVVDVDDFFMNNTSVQTNEKRAVQDRDEKPVTFYKFGPQKTQSVAIDVSLNKLNKCIKVAYMKMTTPKWKDFKGLKLQWKHRIRLNNVIWRAYYMEFRKPDKKKKTPYCYFAVPDDDTTHTKLEGSVLEGMYWKRRMEAVCAQYKRWRTYNRHARRKPKGCCRKRENSCGCDKTQQINMPPQSQTPQNLSTMDDFFDIDDFDNEFTNSLFDSLNAPFLFPNPKESVQCGNADIMQPGLLSLQPSIEEIMSVDYSFNDDNGSMDNLDAFIDRMPSSGSQQEQLPPPIFKRPPNPASSSIHNPSMMQPTHTSATASTAQQSQQNSGLYSAREYDAANMLVDYRNQHLAKQRQLAQNTQQQSVNIPVTPSLMTSNISQPLYSQALYEPPRGLNEAANQNSEQVSEGNIYPHGNNSIDNRRKMSGSVPQSTSMATQQKIPTVTTTPPNSFLNPTTIQNSLPQNSITGINALNYMPQILAAAGVSGATMLRTTQPTVNDQRQFQANNFTAQSLINGQLNLNTQQTRHVLDSSATMGITSPVTNPYHQQNLSNLIQSSSTAPNLNIANTQQALQARNQRANQLMVPNAPGRPNSAATLHDLSRYLPQRQPQQASSSGVNSGTSSPSAFTTPSVSLAGMVLSPPTTNPFISQQGSPNPMQLTLPTNPPQPQPLNTTLPSTSPSMYSPVTLASPVPAYRTNPTGQISPILQQTHLSQAALLAGTTPVSTPTTSPLLGGLTAQMSHHQLKQEWQQPNTQPAKSSPTMPGKRPSGVYGAQNLFITSSAGPTTPAMSNIMYSSESTVSLPSFLKNTRSTTSATSISHPTDLASQRSSATTAPLGSPTGTVITKSRWPQQTSSTGTATRQSRSTAKASKTSLTPLTPVLSPLTPPQYTEMTNVVTRSSPLSNAASDALTDSDVSAAGTSSGSTTDAGRRSINIPAIVKSEEQDDTKPQVLIPSGSKRRNTSVGSNGSSRSAPADSTLHPEERKRILHLHAEKNRRCALKDGFEMLVDAIPVVEEAGVKSTNAVVLNRAAQHIRSLKDQSEQRIEEVDELRDKIAQMNDKIALIQSNLPSSSRRDAPTASNTPSMRSQVLQSYERFSRERSKHDYRFWLMSEIFKPIAQSYADNIHTDPSEREQVLISAREWLNKSWNSATLRPIASETLVRVATKSGAFTDETALPKYIMNEIAKFSQ
ncbi:protein WBSCR14 like protein [Ditylenchus destructor]|nr:protein WBSCR14 like protein [Ditylenchus destructor]